MPSPTYRIVTRGLQPDVPAALAAEQLALLFKCTQDQIAPLLNSKRFTVRKNLDRDAADKYAQALQRCGCVSEVVEEVPPPPAPLTREQTLDVVPVLRRMSTRTEEADPVVVLPFAGDLEIVFRTDPQAPLVRQAALRAAMMTVGELYELAVWNLYVALQPKMAFKQMGQGEDGQSAMRFFSFVETGDGLDATCLLLLPVWQTVAAQAQGPLRIMVPNAHSCYFCGADDALSLAMMSDVADASWSESGDGALSRLTYAVDAVGRVTVVPGAHVQRQAPAPGTYLRTTAQLLVPAAYSLASNPALVTLSDARLRRLQPQLFDVTQWPREADRIDRVDGIRGALARGDAHAAVVIDAAAGVVASYTDELDCVVMLKFDPALFDEHGWQDGTRLLSANTYSSRQKGVAPDLLPGPGDSGRWGNVRPLIADLLTDDRAGLAARKQSIDEAEWTRALDLGRRMHADRGIARDGRPLTAGRPVAPRAQAPADPSAAAASPRRVRTRRRRRTAPRGTFSGCVGNAGIGGLCVLAVWAACGHVLEMQHDGLFYMACFGILVFSFVGLGCLWSAANYLRGA